MAGRYVLLEELGRGAAGVVHRARDLEERRYVAAKVVRGPGAAALAAERRQDDVALIAMELVAGGSLRDLLARRGPLPPPLVALLLGQLLDALAAVHATDVVHGDVKPANLLLRPGPRPHLMLADFGTAARAGRPCALAGTPSYLPPERTAGAAPDPSQDVYAAGLLARRIMAGPAPLLTLCDSMTRVEPGLRPTAEAALRRLRELTGPC